MLSIVNSLNNNPTDYWGINRMNINRIAKISERNIRDREINRVNILKIRAYDNVINLINRRNFTGIHSGRNRWFNTINPTLTQHISPSLIFEKYNNVDYITYEKILGTTDNTPTIEGTVGANFSTNFNKTDNSIDKATIYVLR